MGGAIAHVGMETIGWYRYEGTVEGNGIGREMERRTAEMGGARKWAFNDSECLDAENFKLVADTLITENNIRPLLHSYVVDSITEPMESGGRSIKGVIFESKSGRRAIMAKRVIDATGDADIAYFAGAPTTRE